MKKFIIITILAIGIYSCKENSVTPEANPLTIAELNSTPGFGWFEEEIQLYTPQSHIVDEIRNIFDADLFNFYLYVRPACSCPGSHKQFPQLVKVFREAGIPESSYTLYSMIDPDDINPNADKFEIVRLPAFIVMKSDLAHYSITDTLDYRVANNINADVTMEDLLLEALQK